MQNEVGLGLGITDQLAGDLTGPAAHKVVACLRPALGGEGQGKAWGTTVSLLFKKVTLVVPFQ